MIQTILGIYSLLLIVVVTCSMAINKTISKPTRIGGILCFVPLTVYVGLTLI